MFHYSITEWLFFFYFYCFFGWVFESTYVSIKSRKLINRGFMRGPFLPLYGTGAIMMLVVSMPFQDNVLLTYLAGCVGATLLELVTGITMESLFKVRYWDYSPKKFNYKGHICLSSTIAWGFLTILMTEVVHQEVAKVVFSLSHQVLTVITVLITIEIAADFALSFKAALDLRDVLVGLEKAKLEMEHIQKRLDVLIAFAGDEIAARRQEGEMKAEELILSLEERFQRIKERLVAEPGALEEKVREELMELRSKYMLEREYRQQFSRIRDFYQRNMIKGNPNMYSVKFTEALEELKRDVNEHKDKKGID